MELDELDFAGIQASEKIHAAKKRSKEGGFKNFVLAAFAGSLLANLLTLTVFLTPVAISWHFALLWLCLAWSVLGNGSLLKRTGAALLVWCVGILPVFPLIWTQFDGITGLPEGLLAFCGVLLPSYAAFWFYRGFSGRYVKLPKGQTKVYQTGAPEYKISLQGMFRMTTYCAIALGVAVPLVKYVSNNQNYEILFWGALVVPAVFFLPTIQLVCEHGNGRMQRPVKYLMILCSVFCFLSICGTTVMTGDFPSAAIGSLAITFMYFCTGAFVVAGLAMIRDHRYRFASRASPEEKVIEG